MKGAISYAVFGYGKPTPLNCFPWDSYFRGIALCVRVNRIIYPGWINIINIDNASYNSPYKGYLDWLVAKGLVKVNICKDAPLCMAMLWRLKPIFDKDESGNWLYTHVICRDIDSVGTYREAQAVAQWIQEDKTIHCITDSISHNIPMMGGMIGFRPRYITERLNCKTWQQLVNNGNFNWERKGADQDFLNKFVYPNCTDSATEHFVLGMRHNLKEEDGRHYSIPNIDINVDRNFEADLNALAGHIGASGAYTTPMERFLKEIDPYKDEYKEIEKQFPKIFYWNA